MRSSLKPAVLAATIVGVCYLGAAAAEEEGKLKDIKGCMVFQGKVRKEIPDLLKLKNSDWNDVQKDTKDWVEMAKTLGQQKPPRGSEASWKTQTAKYLATVESIHAAAEKKNAAGVKKGMAAVGMSCSGCHAPHRPKK